MSIASGFAEVNHSHLYYEIAGAGDPIVFLRKGRRKPVNDRFGSPRTRGGMHVKDGNPNVNRCRAQELVADL